MCRNARKSLNAQTEVGQRLRGADITLGALCSALGWHRNTLDSYFPASPDTQPTKLPKGALWDILECDAFPVDLCALLLPDGFVFARVTAGLDHHEVAIAVLEYQEAKAAAHHPDSPDGERISECEQADLDARIARIGGA